MASGAVDRTTKQHGVSSCSNTIIITKFFPLYNMPPNKTHPLFLKGRLRKIQSFLDNADK